MSEFHVIEVVFTDQQVLVESLEDMGYKPVIHDVPVSLEGYHGDKRTQKAHIVIPRGQVGRASNDVGFEKTKEGFIMHASAYDKAWRTGPKIKELNLTYVENKLKKEISGNSFCRIASRKKNEKGQIEIHLRVWN